MMQNDTSSQRLSVAIIGAGAVGGTLARRLTHVGCDLRAVVSRDAADARALARTTGAEAAGTDATLLSDPIDLVFVCVPDDAISGVAASLADVDRSWKQTVVAHTSGAKTADALAPLADAGASILSFHPLQTFTDETPPDAFEGITVGIEGDDDAVSRAAALAKRMGARPVILTRQGKSLYHCAAAVASNGFVALMAVVEEIMAAADIEDLDDSATEMVTPLLQQTWKNLQASPPEDVLTGPVARGDDSTLKAHLDALGDRAPHLIALYSALSTEMTRTAVRGGQLDPETAERMLQRLQTALSTFSEGSSSHEPSH